MSMSAQRIDATIAEDISASAATALVDWTVMSREELRPGCL